VIRDPQILILDEATSKLDSYSEHLIHRAIDEIGVDRTVFIISHRLSSVQHADKIAVLEGGRIIEEGTHESLMKHKGRYAELLKIQTRPLYQAINPFGWSWCLQPCNTHLTARSFRFWRRGAS